jgi:glucose/arabinose dehydrogenase
VQERDGLGDNLPSDYLIRVQQGGFHGWPYAYIGKHPQPGFANLAPDKVEATITPDLLFTAHSSLLDLVFYEGDQFPSEYKGSLFVALKGSWNRSIPAGYKVVRVPFKDGKPEGYYENFTTGFWVSGLNSAPRSGAAPRPSPSPRTDLCWSPTTPAARSGAFPTRARPPSTPVCRRNGRVCRLQEPAREIL